MDDTDRVFAGAIPDLYDRLLVPLIFEPFAHDLAERIAPAVHDQTVHDRTVRDGARVSVLEIAAGTGVVTRTLCTRFGADVDIVATDLNQAMLDRAAGLGTSRPVRWQQADAMALPFGDASFDIVVCQFGAMFFPDRPHAFGEMARVTCPGGVIVVNVWDELGTNDFARVVTESLARRYPHDPPTFLARLPHGYHDPAIIVADARSAVPDAIIEIETVAARSVASTADQVAVAYCHGTPLRHEILALDPHGLDAATLHASSALAQAFGPTDLDGAITAHVLSVTTARVHR